MKVNMKCQMVLGNEPKQIVLQCAHPAESLTEQE